MQTERPRAKTFRDPLVWWKAHEFVLEVYRYTESFPQRETRASFLLDQHGVIRYVHPALSYPSGEAAEI